MSLPFQNSSSRLLFVPWTVLLVLFSFTFFTACDSGGANQSSSSDEGGNDTLTGELGSSVSVRLEEDSGTKASEKAKGDVTIAFFYDDGSSCEAAVTVDDALPVEKKVTPTGCSSSSTRNGIRISFVPAPGSSIDGLALKVLKDDGTVLQSARSASDGTLVSDGGTIPSTASTPEWVGNWDLVSVNGDSDSERNFDLFYAVTETEWVQVTVVEDGRCGVSRFSIDEVQTYSNGTTTTRGVLKEADGLLYAKNQTGATSRSELTVVNGALRYEVTEDANASSEGDVLEASRVTGSIETNLSARADCLSGPSTASNPAWVGDWELVDSDPSDPNAGSDSQRPWDLSYKITETEWVQVTVHDDGRCGVTRFSIDNLQTAFADGATITTSTLKEADGYLYSSGQVNGRGQARITTATSSVLQYEVMQDPNSSYEGSVSKAERASESVETDISARSDCSSSF